MLKKITHKRTGTFILDGTLSLSNLLSFAGFRIELKLNTLNNTQVALLSTETGEVLLGPAVVTDGVAVAPVKIKVLDTSSWPTGTIVTDVLIYKADGERLPTETFLFEIEKEETPWQLPTF